MEPLRVNRILEEWSAIANAARRPATPPRGIVVRSGLPGATLAGASIVVAGLVLAGLLLGRGAPNGGVGSSASTLPTSTAPATTPSGAATTPSAAPTPPAVPAVATCKGPAVSARITLWEGAAGHRIAHVELANAGSASCVLDAMAKPQLVDGDESVLIDGSTPPASATIVVAPGAVIKTLVQDGNFCGPTPAGPVSVAFVFGDGTRIVATPFSPTDATVPPCLGAPGSAGDIEMQPWTP